MRDSDRAYEAILEKILLWKLRSGQAINDEQLQKELKVGKTPLREALFRLTQDGYLTAVPHKGMYVTTFDINQLESLLTLRVLLCGYLSQQLIKNARDEDIDRCQAEMSGLIRVGKEMPLDEVSHADRRFHHMIGELSGDMILMNILTRLETMSGMALVSHARSYYRNGETVKEEYFETFRLIKERDQQGLEAILKRHIPRYVLHHI